MNAIKNKTKFSQKDFIISLVLSIIITIIFHYLVLMPIWKSHMYIYIILFFVIVFSILVNVLHRNKIS